MSTTPSVKKYVIYTAIFGKFDHLLEPVFIPAQCDFVCFTDQPLRSRTWKVIRVEPPVPGDGTRSNRYYKMLPHKFFNQYEISIYIDGNVQVVGNITAFAEKHLSRSVMAGVDHATYPAISLKTLKEHMEHLTMPGQEKKHGEDFALIKRQYDFYLEEGFPDTNGVLWTMMLMRRHNNPSLIRAMEAWWHELNQWSKRDQMSFNYVAWKHHLNFEYVAFGDVSPHLIKRVNHRIPPSRRAYNYFLGAVKRVRRIISR